MAKKPPMRVALDLETTGLHAEQDAILEVAAVKFQGSDVIDTFESLVVPGRSIPYRVQRLTGIKLENLVGAPTFDTIAEKLHSFLGNLPLVGHSIPFDVGFLRRRGLARINQLIDTFELALILMPSLSSYSLGHVAESLGMQVPADRHRAMVDTVLAMNVFLALHERLQTVDLALLKDIANLDAPRSWPLLSFLKQELRDRQVQDGLQGTLARGSLGDQLATQLGMDPQVLSFAIGRQKETITPPVVSQPALPTLQVLEGVVEVIPEQSAMPRGFQTARSAVHEALKQKTSLLMEVTVGSNDYAPALLPTLEWLCEPSNDGHTKRLVITCANQQYARRLVEVILPRLQATFKCQHPIAYLAEHGGYFCVHRWFGPALRRTRGELTAEEARGLAKLGLWAQQTMTGERSELTLLANEISAWERLASGVEHIPFMDKRTVYEHCAYRRKGYCFASLAEERVKAARIVVTTHAGLFDDLSRSHSLLAGIDHRLILDTDLLEEENARWSNAELEQTYLIRLLNTIGAELPDNRYQGLLALAAPSLCENGSGGLSTTPTITKAELDTRMLLWFQSLRQACTAVENLFICFSRLLEEFVQQGSSGSGRDKERGDTANRQGSGRYNERPDQPLRLTGAMRRLSTWGDTEHAWQHVAQRLHVVIDLVREAEKMLLTTQHSRPRLDSGSGDKTMLAAELAAVAQRLMEQKWLGHEALSLSESESVYWLRLPASMMQSTPLRNTVPSPLAASTENTPVLHAQLVQTSALLKRLQIVGNASTIFAGSALSVDNSFAFCRERLGIGNDACPALSVVTERHEQTLLYMPNDVPEPNTAQYQRALDDALVQLATALDGQLIALFTSHAALRSSYGSIKSVLETRGILVLGQGMDGSPRQLWQTFQSQERVVLLGTGGFWEGVEGVQRSPACLFITRLPMPVLNDPSLAARAEHYSDQLRQFTVPIAALRVRRALNRSVWSDTRRNAVVLFDRRVVSKQYGSVILHSLPHCSQRQAAVSHMPETIMDWLTSTGAWE